MVVSPALAIFSVLPAIIGLGVIMFGLPKDTKK